jgi:class 3 adenylate cyclase
MLVGRERAQEGRYYSMATGETRRLAAIMFTDIVGFSRHMGSDEARMLRVLEIHNQHIQHAVTDHHGSVVKIMGAALDLF